MLSATRKGELAAGVSALLWSFFPIVTVLSLSRLSPLFTVAISTALSTVSFALMVTARGHWHMLKVRKAWPPMLLATLFIGIIFYALIFIGYRSTSPGDGAIITLMEAFFTFLIVNFLWKHESFVPRYAWGALCMIIGSLFILLPEANGTWNTGNLFILFATVFPPIGNVYAKRARLLVPADVIMLVRSGISALFLMALAIALEPWPALDSVGSVMMFLLLNGMLIMGFSKIFWIEAIHRIPITKTVALSEIEVLATIILAYVLLGQRVSPEQLLALLPMALGVYLLTKTEPA